MDADINGFIDQTYRPYAIAGQIRDFNLVAKLQTPPPPLDVLDVMQLFVERLTAEIEGYRSQLLRPIRVQRDQVLSALEEAYRQIQDGQSIITGHLASLVAVQDAQDQALARAGLQGLREKLVDSTAKASEQISDLTRKADAARGKEDDVRRTLERLKIITQSIGK